MNPQPMGKSLGICVLAAVVGGLAGGLTHAQGPALLPQRITFDKPQGSAVGQLVRLSASTDADAHENLVVSFRSDTPDVCTVSDFTVTTLAVGTCEITAFQGGSAAYAAAQASGSFEVTANKGGSAQQIVFDPPLGTMVGVPVVLTASSRTLGTQGPGILVTKDPGSPTGLPVSYTSQNRRVCAVAGTTLAPTAAGSCTVVAAKPGNTQYAPADPRIGSFPVGKIPQAIDFRPLRDVAFGQPVTLIATASSGLPVSYRTTTPGVCTVADGAITTMA